MNVTDGRTDIRRQQRPRLRIVSRGKNKDYNNKEYKVQNHRQYHGIRQSTLQIHALSSFPQYVKKNNLKVTLTVLKTNSPKMSCFHFITSANEDKFYSAFVCSFVCLSVSRITPKVVDEF